MTQRMIKAHTVSNAIIYGAAAFFVAIGCARAIATHFLMGAA